MLNDGRGWWKTAEDDSVVYLKGSSMSNNRQLESLVTRCKLFGVDSNVQVIFPSTYLCTASTRLFRRSALAKDWRIEERLATTCFCRMTATLASKAL